MSTISIIGGTGSLGSGLALRWARGGQTVIIGSRDAERAQESAREISQTSGNDSVQGMDNLAAAEAGDILVVTVKFNHQQSTLEQIHAAAQGKIVIDTTVPLVPPKVARVQLPAEGSAGLIAQKILGDNVSVISAFQNISASSLQGDAEIDCDVLVTGNSIDDRDTVVELAKSGGMRAWHAGPLDNSVAAEALTSLLIHMNKRYKSDHTGIRISGIQES